MIVTDSTYLVPAITFANPFPLYCATTPRTDNDFRVLGDHVSRVNDPIFGRLVFPQLGKDAFAAGGFDQLLNPTNSGDKRVIPFFEQDSRTMSEARSRVAYSIQLTLEQPNQRPSSVFAADDTSNSQDHLEDFRDAALIETHHGYAAPNQFSCDVCLEIGERKNQIRLQSKNLVELRVDECGDLRLQARLRRSHRIARHTDNALLLAEQI